MRVDERTLNDPISSSASRAAESQRIQVDTSSSASGSAGAAGDRVDLSGLAGRIAQALQSLAGQSAQRVGQLRQSFQAGTYEPDAEQLGRVLAGS